MNEVLQKLLLVIVVSSLFLLGCVAATTTYKSDQTGFLKAHSTDTPSQLWLNLDATVIEIERDGRTSLFAIKEEKGTQGAGAIGRFFFCCVTSLANQRGFRYFINSDQANDNVLVIFLKNKEEPYRSLVPEKFKYFKLLEVGDADFFKNMCGINSSSKLIDAVSNGDYRTVENLLSEGIYVDSRSPDGSTALIVAAYKGYLNIAKILIANGADVNANSSFTDWDYSGWTALLLAAQEGYVDIVTTLLDNNADVNAKNKIGDTPLTYAALRGNYEVVNILLANGADVNAKNNKGRTSLMDATEEGHADIVNLLKEAGAKE